MVDRGTARRALAESVERAVRGGVDWVQLRERELTGAALLDWCRQLADAARRGRSSEEPAANILVNRRLDVALALAADGVHLGFDAVAARDARQLLGPRALVGISAHRPEEVAAAAAEGASYAHLAPIFAPRSKVATRPALGLAAITAASAHGIPVLAQGGIDPSRCRAVIAAGAAGVAVTGDILISADPGAAAARLRRALDEAAAGRPR